MVRDAKDRRGGFTLVEVAVAVGLVSIVIVAIGMVFSAISATATESDRRLLAQMECDRAVLSLLEDLQTTSTVDADASGQPYFEIQDDAPGTANAILFRRVEGFQADAAADIVEPIYGDPIRYAVDPDGNLVRTQGSERRVVANRVSEVSFTLSPTGTVGFRVSTFAGNGGDRISVENALSITPRNGLER
ncbi:MAG: prepilin-type N-terminal cleavage/methylation domain-containing protein [Planctomycetes bacterium]|nr:prepilin-type N-terminal cleavage/methylation domain-containing protein [Planctomycetota bacterium]